MKKIEAIIRPSKLEEVKDALGKFGINGITVTNVIGCGLQKGRKEVYRGNEFEVNLLSKMKLEIVVSDENLNKVIDIISGEAQTEKIGDGKIFVYNVENAIRIRTGETGESAI